MLSPAPANPAETLVSIDRAEDNGDRAHLSEDQIARLDRGAARLMDGDSTAVRAVESVLNWTVRMPVYRWDAAQHEVNKLARKATKRDVAPPKIEEVSREVIGEGDEAETWIVARLLGAAPVLNGWRCVATLTPGTATELRTPWPTAPDAASVALIESVGGTLTYEGNDWLKKLPAVPTIHTATGESLSPETLALVSMRCDHVVPCKRGNTTFTRKCGSRKRALVFVIEHADHGIKCVGSKCLNEYLGNDALTAWFVFSRFHALGSSVDGGSWDHSAYAQWLADNPPVRGTGSKESPIPVRDFVACCVAHVEAHGYLRSSDARNEGVEATGRQVWHGYQDATHVAPSEEDFARADEIGAWVATLDAGETDRYGEATYLANLAFAVRSSAEDGVSRRSANMIASAVTTFARELDRRAEQAEAAGVELSNEYLPFARDTPITARLRVVRDVRWALSCVDSEGRTVLVRRRKYTSCNSTVEQGAEIVVTGKIGDQSEYSGTRQTFINAPKVYRPEECAVI